MTRESRPAVRPNILLVVVDDMGYSDCEPFGGEMRTPTLAALADAGVRLRNFHTSSLCAPTRSMLLSGVDNHQNGLGVMPPFHSTNQFRQPGYEGPLNHSVATIAELLGDAGYFTCMTGKWHLGHNDGYRPAQRGFERSFAFMGGGASHFDDARPLSPNELPHTVYRDDDRDVTDALPPDFYSSTDFADRMIGYLEGQGDDRPFFAYLAFTSPHDPLQVPDAWLDRRKGDYDGGYDTIRTQRLATMKSLGLIPEELENNPGSGLFPAWDELDADERRLQARKMEIYAAMIENLDHELGRVLAAIEQLGKRDDTLVVFISDNGANPKEPHFYPPNSEAQIARDFDNRFENLGRKGSFISIGGAWAEVANTPLSYFKLTTYEGGTQTPLIVAGSGVARSGIACDQMLHVTDILPTLLDFAGATRPDQRNGRTLAPLYGKSWHRWLTDDAGADIRGPDDLLGFEMIECKAIIKGDWKLVSTAPPYGEKAWELFNLREDPRELDDRADSDPGTLAEMIAEWGAYAAQVGYIPANGESMIAQMGPEAFFDALGQD